MAPLREIRPDMKEIWFSRLAPLALLLAPVPTGSGGKSLLPMIGLTPWYIAFLQHIARVGEFGGAQRWIESPGPHLLLFPVILISAYMVFRLSMQLSRSWKWVVRLTCIGVLWAILVWFYGQAMTAQVLTSSNAVQGYDFWGFPIH